MSITPDNTPDWPKDPAPDVTLLRKRTLIALPALESEQIVLNVGGTGVWLQTEKNAASDTDFITSPEGRVRPATMRAGRLESNGPVLDLTELDDLIRNLQDCRNLLASIQEGS